MSPEVQHPTGALSSEHETYPLCIRGVSAWENWCCTRHSFNIWDEKSKGVEGLITLLSLPETVHFTSFVLW